MCPQVVDAWCALCQRLGLQAFQYRGLLGGGPSCYAFDMDAAADLILRRFRKALDGLYGDRLERVLLYGSRARGDARQDSDYDIAVFLRTLDSFGVEAKRLAELETDLLRDTGAVVNAMPFAAGPTAQRRV